MDETPKESLMDQLRSLLRDALEYLNRTLELQQARVTALALSGVLFFLQILVAFFLAGAAFILFNVAIGLALKELFGGLWAVLALGGFYTVLAFLLSFKAIRWLKKLKS